MPMQFGKVTIESPQEVLARLKQERTAMASSGNMAAMHQANVGQALDAIFGNPEVKSAAAIQNRLKSAQAGVQAQEGDDDVTSEMRRLAAMRDAVADLDPALANEMTNQLLQLGTVKAEREKLMAQTGAAQAKAAAAANKDQRDAITFGFGTADKAMEIEAAAGKGINYWRRKGGRIEHIALPEQDSLERRRLLAEGWLEGTGPTTEAEAASIVNPPTKPVMTDLQTAYLAGQTQLDAVARISQKFDPSFLELPTQLVMKGAAFADKLGAGKMLPAGTVATLQKFTEFKRNSVDSFNLYIKAITGAAMAVPEAERIQKGFPDADKDSPQVFLSKMRETARQILGIQRRSAEAIKNGLQIGPDQMEKCRAGGPCIWDSIAVPSVSDEEVDGFLARYGIPARAAGAKSNTGVSKDGWTTTKSGARVKEIK